jgi:hypothetical protein
MLLCSSALAFVALVPSRANSTNIVTVQADACHLDSTNHWVCGFPAGTPFAAGAAGVYFDFSCGNVGYADMYLTKISYTGTATFDESTANCTSGSQDVYLPAKATLANPNVYDYWAASIGPLGNGGQLLGMALLSR